MSRGVWSGPGNLTRDDIHEQHHDSHNSSIYNYQSDTEIYFLPLLDLHFKSLLAQSIGYFVL